MTVLMFLWFCIAKPKQNFSHDDHDDGALDGGGHHDHGYNLKLRSSMTIDHASHDDHNEVAIENEVHDDLTLRSCMAKPKQNASQAQ